MSKDMKELYSNIKFQWEFVKKKKLGATFIIKKIAKRTKV